LASENLVVIWKFLVQLDHTDRVTTSAAQAGSPPQLVKGRIGHSRVRPRYITLGFGNRDCQPPASHRLLVQTVSARPRAGGYRV